MDAAAKGSPTTQRSRQGGQPAVSPFWTIGALVLFVALGPTLLGGTFLFGPLLLAGVYGTAVSGLSMLTGYAGQISMGQSAMIGLGAYGSAIAVTRWGAAPIVGVLLGAALSLTAALVTGVVFRLTGVYLAVATLGLGYIVEDMLLNLRSWTRGSDGIAGLPHFSILGISFDTEKKFFSLAWAVLVVALVVTVNVSRSRVGRGLQAIHTDEGAARAQGIPVLRYKVTVWIMASMFAGVSGSLYAHYMRFVSPDLFTLGLSVVLVAAVVLGGNGSLFGPVFGIVLLQLLPEFTKAWPWLSTTLITGIILVVVMVFAPGGLAELWHRTIGCRVDQALERARSRG